MSKTLANNEQDRLKYLLKDKCIFIVIVIDESEVDKTKFSNVIVGDIVVPEKTYLIECCVTETVNQSIICMKIDDILRKLDIVLCSNNVYSNQKANNRVQSSRFKRALI